MPETPFGFVEEYAPAEVANTAVGVAIGAFGHMLTEPAMDNLFKKWYPEGEKYMAYSTLATAGIYSAIGLGLWLYARKKAGLEWLQYVAIGIFFAELVQLLDCIRISFELR